MDFVLTVHLISNCIFSISMKW